MYHLVWVSPRSFHFPAPQSPASTRLEHATVEAGPGWSERPRASLSRRASERSGTIDGCADKAGLDQARLLSGFGVVGQRVRIEALGG